MTIYIYKAEGFDEGFFVLVDSFSGSSKEECEAWADDNYVDYDYYRWSYTEM